MCTDIARVGFERVGVVRKAGGGWDDELRVVVGGVSRPVLDVGEAASDWVCRWWPRLRGGVDGGEGWLWWWWATTKQPKKKKGKEKKGSEYKPKSRNEGERRDGPDVIHKCELQQQQLHVGLDFGNPNRVDWPAGFVPIKFMG